MSVNEVLNNINITLRHINMCEFSLNVLTCFNTKVGSVIDRDFWVLEIGKYTVLYIQLSTLCVMYSDMML